eukprot:8811790-Lingulodinium_polyedra.AAC.1
MWPSGKKPCNVAINFSLASFGRPRWDRPGSVRAGSFLNFVSKPVTTVLQSESLSITSACNLKMLGCATGISEVGLPLLLTTTLGMSFAKELG